QTTGEKTMGVTFSNAAALELLEHMEFPIDHLNGKYQIEVDFAPDGRIVQLIIEADDGEGANIDQQTCWPAIAGASTLRRALEAQLKQPNDENNKAAIDLNRCPF